MTTDSGDTWVPFSHRYGYAGTEEISRWCAFGGETLGDEVWRSRHSPEVTAWDEPDPLFRCTCPGTTATRCRVRASQEDRLCDPCRDHCWGMTDTGTKRRLVDAYGAAL